LSILLLIDGSSFHTQVVNNIIYAEKDIQEMGSLWSFPLHYVARLLPFVVVVSPSLPLSLSPSLPPVEVSFKFLLKKPGRVNRKMFMETGTLETSKKEEKKRVCNKVKRPKDSALSSLVL